MAGVSCAMCPHHPHHVILVLVWLPGAIGLLIKPSKWRNPREIGTWQQGHPPTRRRDCTCLRCSASPWPRYQRREYQRTLEAACPFLLSGRPIFKESSNSARGHLSQKLSSSAELRNKTHAEMVSGQPNCMVCREGSDVHGPDSWSGPSSPY